MVGYLLAVYLQRAARVVVRLRGRPFIDVTHHVHHAPTRLVVRRGPNWFWHHSPSPLRYRVIVNPGVAPWIDVVLIAPSRSIFPLFFGGQTILHPIALRAPLGKYRLPTEEEWEYAA